MAFGYPNDTASGNVGQLMKKAGVNSTTVANLADGITGGVVTFSASLGGNITLTLPTASGTVATLSGGTYTGKITTVASATGGAGFNLPHGAAPTSPVDGDMWTTTAALFVRINGVTTQLGSGSGTIGGTIAANQIAFGSGTDAITGASGFTATALSSGVSMLINSTTTSTSGTNFFSGTQTVNPGSSAGSSTYIASNNSISNTANNLNLDSATWYGIKGSAVVTSTSGSPAYGTIGAGYFTPVINISGASNSVTLTAMYGARVEPSATVGTGATVTVTNYYGIHLGSIGGVSGTLTITNRYGVYQADTNAVNFFAGVTGVGNATPSASTALITPASTTSISSLRIPHGSAPSSPVNGDVWTTTTAMFVRINGSTVQLGTGISGTIASTQVAVGNGTNSLTGTSAWTIGSVSTATPETFSAGNYANTGSVSARTSTITANGSSGIGSSSIVTTDDNTTTLALTAAAASGSLVFGATNKVVVSSSNSAHYVNAALYGAQAGFTFNSSNIANTTILGSAGGLLVQMSCVGTSNTSSQTLSNVYGINILPGTFSLTSGGTWTITNFYGIRIQTLTTSGAGSITVTNRYGVYQDDSAAVNFFAGDVRVGTAGKGLFIKEGSNAKMGTAVLVGGTVTVSTTAVGTNSRIFLCSNVDGGTPGFLRVTTITNATSFVITSSSGTDTSTVAWIIIDPA